jgi:CzcA family heavy metal efflux pump
MNRRPSGILAAIVRFSLRFAGVIIALACLLVGYGLYSLSRAKYDVFPEFAPPQVVVQTEAPGLAPEQVEVLVTQPIENAINGVTAIESLRSGSIQGLSIITVTFQSGSDLYRNRQVIAENLATLVGHLPQGVESPIISPLTTSMSFVLTLGLTSEKVPLMGLRTIADWLVKPRLLAVPGVAKIAVWSRELRQIQIQVQPELMIKHNVGIEDVLSAARRATGVRGAGFIENENQRLILQAEGQALTADQIARTIVLHQNAAEVTLGNIARVVDAPEPPFGGATIMGRPGVLLDISAQYGTNTVDVTEGIEKALEELRPGLDAQGITVYPDLFRPANFIQIAIRNIRSSFIIGGVLVAGVLLLFLFNFRTAAISLTAIPLSLLSTVIILQRLGFSLNIMTLGGLAIATGQVVDDAVIDVENILRRLRENRLRKDPRPAFQVVLDASLEVRHPVVYATFAVALVFIPVLTLSGVAGRLFAPLGITFIIATLVSLVVALTLTSALCLVLLGHHIPEKEPPVVRWLKEKYQSFLFQTEKNPRPALAGVALLMFAGLVVLPFLGSEFLPEHREGHFVVPMITLSGTSLEETERLGRQVSLELLKLSYVRTVAQRIGRAERSDDVFGTHWSEFEIDLKPLGGKQAASAATEIRAVLAQFPGAGFGLKTFLEDRIEETLAGYTSSVVVNILGPDLDTLDKKAQEISTVLRKVRGAIEVMVQSPPETPQVVIRLRKENLALWGLGPGDALDAISTAFQGNVVGQVYEGNRVFDVSVVLDPGKRKRVSDIRTLPLRTISGAYILLGQLADVYEASGRYIVLHEGARRVQTVTCNVQGRSVSSFVREAQGRILSGISLPGGTYVQFTGTAEAQARSRRDLLMHSLLAAVALVLLLSIVMGNYRSLLLVLINLPFALVGGVLAAFITGGKLSIGSLVGFVTIFGITLRNSMLMLSHYEHLVSMEGAAWGVDTAVRGASERLAPILMTALVTALAMLPLAVANNAQGHEIQGPMAIVILGGLITSTILNLLVMPTLALRYGRFTEQPEEIIDACSESPPQIKNS